MERRIRILTLVTLAYIAAYSILPHKEVRSFNPRPSSSISTGLLIHSLTEDPPFLSSQHCQWIYIAETLVWYYLLRLCSSTPPSKQPCFKEISNLNLYREGCLWCSSKWIRYLDSNVALICSFECQQSINLQPTDLCGHTWGECRALTIISSVKAAFHQITWDVKSRVLYMWPGVQLRFLLPVMAVLNIPAACGTAFILRGQKKNLFRRSLSVGFWGMLITSSAVTFLLLAVSHLNYPGGHAMSTVHKLEPCNDGRAWLLITRQLLGFKTMWSLILSVTYIHMIGPCWQIDIMIEFIILSLKLGLMVVTSHLEPESPTFQCMVSAYGGGNILKC